MTPDAGIPAIAPVPAAPQVVILGLSCAFVAWPKAMNPMSKHTARQLIAELHCFFITCLSVFVFLFRSSPTFPTRVGKDPVASLNGIRKRDTSDNRRPAESIPDAALGGHDESVAEAARRYGLQARTETR